MRSQGQRPKTVSIGIFHVRDVDRVKELLADFQSFEEKRRSTSRKRAVPDRRRGVGPPADGPHMSAGPMHLTCDHFFVAALSRPAADELCEMIGERLGRAVEYVVTRTFKVPKAAEGKRKRTAGGRPPSGDDRHRPRRRSSM